MDTAIKNTDTYIALQPVKVRVVLEKLRFTIQKAAPKAEEVISYGMPAFKYHGMLVYFAAFKNHCSFFPGSKAVIARHKSDLISFKTSAGTIQFTIEKPLPAPLVTKIVKARVKQNLEKSKTKKVRSKK